MDHLDHGDELGGVRAPGRRHRREGALCARKHFEKSYADVLIDEPSLAGELRCLITFGAHKLLASFVRHSARGFDPHRKGVLEFAMRSGREQGGGESAVPLKAIARSSKLIGEGQRAAAEGIDRHGIFRRGERRPIESREGLHLIPRQVSNERVLRDLQFDA